MYFNAARLRLYLGGLLVLQIVAVVNQYPYIRAGQVDFRTFYTAGHMLPSGQIYNYAAELAAQNAWVSPNRYALPYMFPPFAALLFVPLARVSYRAAYLIFFTLNLGLCGGALAVMRPWLPTLYTRWPLLAPMLFLTFMPLGRALVFGQVSILLLFLYCCCFAALQSERPVLAGFLLSFALIKFQIALPVVLLFLIWRQWRFIAGFFAGASALILISIRISGFHGFLEYLRSLAFMSRQTASETTYAMFSAQMPNLYGFFHSILPGSPGYLLTAVGSLAVVLWAATRKPSLPLALLAGMLVSYHLYLYDLTLLLLPVGLILDAELAGRGNSPALYASTLLLAAPLLRFYISLNFEYLFAIPVLILFLSIDQIGKIPSRRRESQPTSSLIPNHTSEVLAGKL